MKIHVDNGNAIKEMKKLYNELNSKHITLSITRAINSTLGIVRTDVNKAIRARYNMTPTMVNNSAYIVQAKYDRLEGYVKLYSNPIPLAQFNPRQVIDNTLIKRFGGRGKKGAFGYQRTRANDTAGVIIEIIKGKSENIQSAFMLFRGNGVQVKAKGRYSSGFQFNDKESNKSLKGVSIYSAYKNPEIQSRVEVDAKSKFRYLLAYEMEKRLKKIGEGNSRLQ